jgi:hypothetical protein
VRLGEGERTGQVIAVSLRSCRLTLTARRDRFRKYIIGAWGGPTKHLMGEPILLMIHTALRALASLIPEVSMIEVPGERGCPGIPTGRAIWQ